MAHEHENAFKDLGDDLKDEQDAAEATDSRGQGQIQKLLLLYPVDDVERAYGS